jgi:hypothetical protein
MDTADSITGKKEQSGNVLHTFFVAPHQCFRMVKSALSQATHCAEPVVWKGPWRDVSGELWTVEACERHKPVGGIDPSPSDPHTVDPPDRQRYAAN